MNRIYKRKRKYKYHRNQFSEKKRIESCATRKFHQWKIPAVMLEKPRDSQHSQFVRRIVAGHLHLATEYLAWRYWLIFYNK